MMDKLLCKVYKTRNGRITFEDFVSQSFWMVLFGFVAIMLILLYFYGIYLVIFGYFNGLLIEFGSIEQLSIVIFVFSSCILIGLGCEHVWKKVKNITIAECPDKKKW